MLDSGSRCSVLIKKYLPIILGNRFGRLVVVGESTRNKYGHRCWPCRCDCGKEITVRAQSLNDGTTRSCRCINIDKMTQVKLKPELDIKIHRGDKCVEWSGTRNDQGYGQRRASNKIFYVHRRAWEMAIGQIPEGLMVLHRCDNPACYNVDHLFLGTAADNARDMIAKGRASWQR